VISAPQFFLAKAGENFVALAPLTKEDLMKNRNVTLTTIFLAIGCFAVLPKAQAVSPAPDGCYPGFTTAEGCNALNSLTTGAGNTGLGWRSLYVNTTGSYNTGLGAGALVLNNADSNTAVGTAALLFNTTGPENVAVGTDALVFNDTGGFNTAIGSRVLFNNTTGDHNVAVGGGAFAGPALFSNTIGRFNTAVGEGALFSNTEGGYNTANGAGALADNIGGSGNVAVGLNALYNNIGGSNNVALGNEAGFGATTGSHNIYIGYQIEGSAGESNACYIGSIFGQTTSNGGTAVYVDASNKLGTLTSSKRFKEEIKPMDKASDALFSLKPVTFRYKKEIDPAGAAQLGLVAEEVEKVNPNLVVRDKEGKPYSVRYDQVNAMLLNEFLKEHRKVEEQQASIAELRATVAQQQKEFQAAIAEQRKQFEARLKQQDAKIQSVDDRIELSKPAARTLATNQ
jgi:hypothetical protein